MNKQEFITKLESLDLPIGEYYILSSGCLLMYGLRTEVGDIDLCVSKELFETKLREKYNLNEGMKNECNFYKIDDFVEIVVNDKNDENYKFEYDIVDGYPVQRLGIILRDKKKRNLPKDRADIEKIDDFLRKNFTFFNIKEHEEFIKEIAILTQKEWGNKNLTSKEFDAKVEKKIEKIKSAMNDKNYCKLILLFKKELVGFISIFPHDSDEREELTPWYATMYVKEEYRGMGYSKLLNEAILSEAKKRNIEKLYLKTDLENYYEKFGAKYIETLENGEQLMCFEI